MPEPQHTESRSDDSDFPYSYTDGPTPPLPSPPGSQIPAPLLRQSMQTLQSQLNECETKDRPLIDIIQEHYDKFNSHGLIVEPFEEESRKDAEFEAEFSAMLLEVVLETHAWASARPRKEQQSAGQSLELKVAAVMNVESEQGMLLPDLRLSTIPAPSLLDRTRARLNEFVMRIKTALAALTGV